MPNIASVFKAEISRLARKEIRENSDALRKAVTTHRAEIADLKRRVQALESALRRVAKSAERAQAAAPAADAAEAEHRFSAKGLATNRQRLGLSAADFGLLVGTTGQSIYAWESGKSKPRAGALAAIAALRGIGKREVAEKLAALKG